MPPYLDSTECTICFATWHFNGTKYNNLEVAIYPDAFVDATSQWLWFSFSLAVQVDGAQYG